ncbi:MAG: hypothetical protein SGCHY_005322, partial [Lobulomycetales sp.]
MGVENGSGILGITTAPQSRKPKVKYLEGLRGLAALAVLNRHTVQHVLHDLGTPSQLLFLIFSHSKLAVVIFLILSGRVIANSILKRPTIQVAFDTAVRRVFRLVFPCLCIWFMHWCWKELGIYDIKLNSFVKKTKVIDLIKINKGPFSIYDIFAQTWKMFVHTRPNDRFVHLKGFR